MDERAIDRVLSNARVINIVNEYDLVARADKSYIRSLLDLYSSATRQGSPNPCFPSDTIAKIERQSSWELPLPDLQHLGPIVVLRTSPPPVTGNNSSFPPQTALSAFKLTAKDLSDLVFCRVSVHSRKIYSERIQQMKRGCWNGRTEWPSGKDSTDVK